jgi:hypothetical protein
VNRDRAGAQVFSQPPLVRPGARSTCSVALPVVSMQSRSGADSA